MSTTDENSDQPPGWLEALHDAVASQSDADFQHPQLDTVSPDRVDKTRQCLRLLEQVRRDRQQVPSQLPPSRAQRVGRFEIVRELGRGGFGVVFLAVDPRVGRRVALKLPRAEMLLGDDARRRFVREARAAGVLEHANLIPVHEVGDDGPVCYIASAFCDGPNLAQWLAQRRQQTSEREAATLVEALARGVAHAHQRGVLHRDIKPSNILLEPKTAGGLREGLPLSAVTPRLTDFGLAKVLQANEDETRSCALIGTPTYMAPEQAEGRVADISPRTDIHALGVVLFELLAGVPPLQGQSDVQTLQLVSRGDVPRLARFRPEVSRDLEAIVLKCLERDAARRFAAADELADDLARFLRGEPTRARPASAAERLGKWARRRPTVAALSALVIAGAITLGGGGWWYSNQLREALEQVEAREAETRQFLYVASVNRAQRALDSNHAGEAKQQLEQWSPKQEAPDLRDFSWRYLWDQLHGEERTLAGHGGAVYAVRYSRDGSRLATASADQTARIWDVATGKTLHVLRGHDGDVNNVVFSPDSALVGTVGDDGTVRIWNASDGSLLRQLDKNHGRAFGIAFSPDGKLCATCGENKEIYLWNASSWQVDGALTDHGKPTGLVEISSSGKFLVASGDDGAVYVWDLATRKLLHRLPNECAVSSVSISRDETQLLCGEREEGRVRLWDLQTGALVKVVGEGHYGWIHSVVLDPSNRFVGVATKEGVVELIDVRTSQVDRRLRGHAVRVWSLAFSPDGKRLATSSGDGAVKVWRLDHRAHELVKHRSRNIYTLSPGANGKHFVAGDSDGGVSLFDAENCRLLWETGRVFDVIGDFDGDGRRDEGMFVDGMFQLRLAVGATRQFQFPFKAYGDLPVVGDWNGDGRDDLGIYRYSTSNWVFAVDGEILPEDPSLFTGPVLRVDPYVPLVCRWPGEDRDSVGLATCDKTSTWTVRFFRDSGEVVYTVTGLGRRTTPIAGRWLAGSADSWGYANGDKLWRMKLPQDAKQAAADKVVAPALETPVNWPIDQVARNAAFDLASNAFFTARVHGAVISRDEKLIAAIHTSDPRVELWDARTKQLKSRIKLSHPAFTIAFSPSEDVLAVGDERGQLSFFDPDLKQELRRVQLFDQQLEHLAYSPDGALLAAFGDLSSIKVCDSEGNVRATFVAPLHGTTQSMKISNDGRLLAVSGNDRLITVWDILEGRLVASLAGHTDTVKSIAFSPDGRTLASGSEDGAARLWDLATRQEIYTLGTDLGPIEAILFSHDGTRLMAAGRDAEHGSATINVWSTKHRP